MRALAPWLVALALSACGKANSLGGSIDESFSLEFDEVQIRKQGQNLLVEYVKDLATNQTNKVCKVVVDTEDLELGNDTKLNGDVFLQRVQISRVATTGGDFPPVESGTIEFQKFEFTAGGRIDGEFDTVLTNGRTLYGTFDGSVQEVDES